MSRYFNEALYADDFDDFIAHHGILGMKWGIRRYQNADGTLTAAGRKRYNLKTNPDGSTTLVRKKRATFKQKRNLKKARKAAAVKRASDAEKERLVNYGSASELSQHLNELSNDQKQRAITRLNLDSQITQFSDKEKARQKSKVDKLLDTGDKLARGLGTIVKIGADIRTLRRWMNDDDEDDSPSVKDDKDDSPSVKDDKDDSPSVKDDKDDSPSVKKEKPSKSEKKVESTPSPKVNASRRESDANGFKSRPSGRGSERSKGPDVEVFGPDDIEVENSPKRKRSRLDRRKHYDDIIDSFAFEYPDYSTRLSSNSQKVLDSVLELPGPTNLLEDKHK